MPRKLSMTSQRSNSILGIALWLWIFLKCFPIPLLKKKIFSTRCTFFWEYLLLVIFIQNISFILFFAFIFLCFHTLDLAEKNI